MDVTDRIKQQLEGNPVLVYMKGSPDFPQCGFSSRVANALKSCSVEFSYVDILQDQELRESLKQYSNWPTYPQLYLNGELVGGCDIIMELHEKGELESMVQQAAAGGSEKSAQDA